MKATNNHLLLARVWLLLFVVGLVLAGLTAIPLQAGLDLAKDLVGPDSRVGDAWPAMARWIVRVHRGVTEVRRQQPFLLFGFDWLAFGHFAIAIFFLGAVWNPGRHLWLIHAGMIICLLVVPWALLFGPVRKVPLFWRLIDCGFGVMGFMPLLFARHYTLLAVRQRRHTA